MNKAVRRYEEPLKKEELSELMAKETKERRQYFVVFRLLMIGSFILPFIASWYRAYEGAPNAFSYVKFFVSATILITISAAATYLSFKRFHSKLLADIKGNMKVVETWPITKKVTIPSKNAYYFYTESKVKLSISVSEDFFNNLQEGDEVSIEYTPHSHIYLGYF